MVRRDSSCCIYVQFTFQIATSRTALGSQLMHVLEEEYVKDAMDFSALYDVCQMGNLEEIQKIFYNHTLS